MITLMMLLSFMLSNKNIISLDRLMQRNVFSRLTATKTLPKQGSVVILKTKRNYLTEMLIFEFM